jgi:hypothetical protein
MFGKESKYPIRDLDILTFNEVMVNSGREGERISFGLCLLFPDAATEIYFEHTAAICPTAGLPVYPSSQSI